ncbi:uncharacterized protein HMPREF1541_00670 [Cyphellophora europaea CBS 101466]|uniref:Uncharacterized protein n=1 Tax=Cyphellophora europaea (strain CBS 101466) TaxID=1220924 RepID=W2SCZ1_CYPE1|nr:uncharacterized protein HMPREF1541_00670 [Cyphellophora europaea CBS 101466]ETN46485.1 hypothetical protein HMPREF1541_00670 [Cyphellophora europaea CBS 101466]
MERGGSIPEQTQKDDGRMPWSWDTHVGPNGVLFKQMAAELTVRPFDADGGVSSVSTPEDADTGEWSSSDESMKSMTKDEKRAIIADIIADRIAHMDTDSSVSSDESIDRDEMMPIIADMDTDGSVSTDES